jgi:arginine exporter protein ArgO
MAILFSPEGWLLSLGPLFLFGFNKEISRWPHFWSVALSCLFDLLGILLFLSVQAISLLVSRNGCND